jgi:hypothetical protein
MRISSLCSRVTAAICGPVECAGMTGCGPGFAAAINAMLDSVV